MLDVLIIFRDFFGPEKASVFFSLVNCLSLLCPPNASGIFGGIRFAGEEAGAPLSSLLNNYAPGCVSLATFIKADHWKKSATLPSAAL